MLYVHCIGTSSKMSAQTLKKHSVHNFRRLTWCPCTSALRVQWACVKTELLLRVHDHDD